MGNSWRVMGWAVFVAVAGAAAAAAQGGDRCEGAGGVRVDDGTYENSLQCGSGECHMVQKLTPPSYPARLTKACLCWRSPMRSSMEYEIELWDDNGAGGGPMTFIDSREVAISELGPGDRFEAYDCTDFDLELTSGSVYVGARWSPAAPEPGDAFYLCTDQSPGTPEADAFLSASGVFWTAVPAVSGARALGIRAEFETQGAPTCVASDTALCLGSGRFRVSVTWENFAGNTGVGHASPLTGDSGTFWFFGPENVEMLVKVVDACGLEGFENFWFFAAATTNVEYEITVHDTVADQTKRYRNELGVASPAVVDTAAFDTCGE